MAAPTLNSKRVLHPQYLALRELCICDETQTDQSASKFGWGVTPVAASSRVTFTQTYSTALATNPAALTDSSGGTADGTIEAVGATNGGDVSGAINNNFKEVANQLLALQKLNNSLIDALQALGIVL